MSDTANTQNNETPQSSEASTGVDAFLRELQQEFLADPESHLRTMREALGEIYADPVRCIRSVRKICQAIPPLAEPVGFKHLAALVSELEAILRDLESAYQALGGAFQEDDNRVLEFFLGDAISSVESYYTDLKVDYTDTTVRADERRPCMRVLSHWRPTGAMAAPVTTPMMVSEEDVIEALKDGVDTAHLLLALDEPPTLVSKPEPTPAPPPAVVASESVASCEPAAVPAKDNVVPLRPSQDDPGAGAGEKAVLTQQYLVCRASILDSKNQFRSFAIPVRQVLEVVDYQVVNPLPYPRGGIAGMLNFRGDPLPILVCEDHGGDSAAAAWERKGYIVIAKIGDRTFGFQMEQVLSVTTLNPKEFQQPEGVLSTGGSSWITHMVKVEEDVVMVMDLNRALAA